MAFVINIDGEVDDLGAKPGLKAMQRAVGGLIERVELGSVTVYVNEEGLVHDLPVNEAVAKATGMVFRGPVIIMDDGDEEE